jgi:hypothetical protein
LAAAVSEPRWIRFEETVQPPGRKTKVWNVVAKDDGLILGSVFWYGAWRRYVFGPTADCDTVYEQRCLRDIAGFVEARSNDHKLALITGKVEATG